MYNGISLFKIMENSMKFYTNKKDQNEYIMYMFTIFTRTLTI